MTIPQLEIMLIASVVAVACALPGVFLILRRMAMMSDAISHAILFGIVTAFFIVHDISSPFLILGAALTGVLTVFMVEAIYKTRLVREDAAIGLVFPVLFSIGVIMISRYAGNVHIDTDAVLLGELAFAPFDRFIIGDFDMGPRSLWVMSTILVLNLMFILLFFKELKLSSFDTALAAALGFAPTVLHYSLMTLVSLTAVGAFDAVGSILVVALMIAPPTTAFLLTNRLSVMLWLSALAGIFSAISGYVFAHYFDVNIAGSMATMSGVIFLLTFVFAPERGWLAARRRKYRQRWEFAQKLLAVHVMNHQGRPEAGDECHISTVHLHMNWERDFAERVVKSSRKNGLIELEEEILILTGRGKEVATEAMVDF